MQPRGYLGVSPINTAAPQHHPPMDELATLAELVKVADQQLAQAIGDLSMVEDDLNPSAPGKACGAQGDGCLTLYDRIKVVSERASYVSELTSRIRCRLGKAE